MNKLVSIITPTYNCGDYIEETIRSVINQTYVNWEMIIVDDVSTDDTEEIVKKYTNSDQRIKYYKLKINSGAAVARTKAIEMANGSYIAFLDSDDLWTRDKLEKQLNFMEENNINFSCTSYEQIDEKKRKLGKIVKCISKTDYNRMLLDCPVGNSTVIYNVDNLGKFKVPNIRKRNDDALWLQILKKEQYIYGLNEVLMKYRIRDASISSNKFSLIKYHWKLYREIEKFSAMRSAFHIMYWCVLKIFKIK